MKFRAYQNNKILTQAQSGIYGTKVFLDKLYEDSILMESTYMFDVLGKEIYVGDILSERWRVEVFKSKSNAFMIKFHVGISINKPITLIEWFKRRLKAGTIDVDGKVIGNIFENIELAKTEDDEI